MKYLFLFLFPFLASAQSDFENAEKYYQEKQFVKSQALFEKIASQNPNNIKALEYLGDIQCQYKNWKNAAPYYKKIIQFDSGQANYYYKYGGVMAMQAKESNKLAALLMIDDIKSAFEKAIKINPKHIDARWALIEVYIQLPVLFGGSETKAIKYADELLKISPVDGYLSKGHIFEYYKEYAKAEQEYQKAIAVGQSKTSYQKLANLYKNKMDMPEKAKQTLTTYNNINKL